MTTIHIPSLCLTLLFLVILSGFFSGSETGMMSINRYRLRHKARKGVVPAKRVVELLERPDRLLGVILIGNTFANILASALATVIAVHFFGDLGVILATVILTLVILIFSEAAPKTLAAMHPEVVAFTASLPLKILLRVLYPLVWFVSVLANGILRLFHVRVKRHGIEPLSAEELRAVVNEATGKISSNYQQMLLRILDLERVTVEDVMVPRNEIYGIDLESSWEAILEQLTTAEHEHLPLYRENIDKVHGILNLRKILSSLQQRSITKETILDIADPIYFVPEGALVSKQLLNFQKEQKSVGLVVDEYGDIQGLVTLQDILEEIVGEFEFGLEDVARMLRKQKDGSYVVSGNIPIRELNRVAGWTLPTNGPKTLSGLVIEHLEMIPVVGIAARISGYPMEVMQVSGNIIRQVRVWPELHRNIGGAK